MGRQASEAQGKKREAQKGYRAEGLVGKATTSHVTERQKSNSLRIIKKEKEWKIGAYL